MGWLRSFTGTSQRVSNAWHTPCLRVPPSLPGNTWKYLIVYWFKLNCINTVIPIKQHIFLMEVWLQILQMSSSNFITYTAFSNLHWAIVNHGIYTPLTCHTNKSLWLFIGNGNQIVSFCEMSWSPLYKVMKTTTLSTYRWNSGLKHLQNTNSLS